MAQIGSFVPGVSARLPIFDAIFLRVGAKDNLWAGRSTLAVELDEAGLILQQATSRFEKYVFLITHFILSIYVACQGGAGLDCYSQSILKIGFFYLDCHSVFLISKQILKHLICG